MDNSNNQKLMEFIEKFKSVDRRVEKLELAHQPIQGNTIKATENRIYFNLFAESPSILTTDAFTGSLGAIIYDTTASKNAAPAVQFYKKSNMTFIDGLILVQYFEGIKDTGSAYVSSFASNIRVRLNGTRTAVSAGAYPLNFPWYRVNGGTVLTTHNPSSDGQVFTISLGATEIALLTNGVNSIIAQSDTDDPINYCYAKLYLILSGYEDRS